MELRLDEEDIAILNLIQRNSRLTAREIAGIVRCPITTVFSKIKRMEKLCIIRDYRAVLDAKRLDYGTIAFILATASYHTDSARAFVLNEIAKIPQVQELHTIAGDWDLLIKIREKDVASMGKAVLERLRLLKGLEKTHTCVVFETYKETTEIPIR